MSKILKIAIAVMLSILFALLLVLFGLLFSLVERGLFVLFFATSVLCFSIGTFLGVFIFYQRNQNITETTSRRLEHPNSSEPTGLQIEQSSQASFVPLSTQPVVSLQQSRSPRELTRKEKGDLFESFMVACFVREDGELIDWRGDKVGSWMGKPIYPKSSSWPDLEFLNRQYGVYYAIECKWRANWGSGKITLSDSKERMLKYAEYSEHRDALIPVFMALGVGGRPDAPEELYVFPLRSSWLNNQMISYLMSKQELLDLAANYPNEVYIKGGRTKLRFVPHKDPVNSKIVSKY